MNTRRLRRTYLVLSPPAFDGREWRRVPRLVQRMERREDAPGLYLHTGYGESIALVDVRTYPGWDVCEQRD